ncbi:serine/threonine-protein kinase [Sphingomonas sp. SUN039]|uniref:serine/threonine-protein kinase n=1 Tax=Sphingomonas sp. SUN039 TaxID=2937787 RepID=UPI002164B502|nr:serine/threonine-protein kinase [Sphingomonas sp. SUN039]UVO54728.1 serine/threonine protein kinase [Sphingomonas sp. SUN039]
MSTDADALRIVEAALGLDDPQARAALIVAECGGDAGLRTRVEELLSREGGDFRLLPTESFIRPLSIVDSIPERIGPYRVTGEIARGGMGAVVKAERDDGVFAQTVAIKLIRGDLASPRAQARFAEERRILARLSHPGIVRILDGGDADGRPWLAMDFVDGVAVTEALDARGADRAARLDAVETVCDAVAYAHRNLVIHADIKPSNVLMTADGRVHLLDFGIARLIVGLDPDESGDPYPLTKGYAAPERGVGVAPTIASDVFSLGVLMLAMLGVAVPGPDTVHVPGTRLPVGQLDGDLAAIAGRALREQPGDRYPDVAALLSDIRRHRAFVPVAARDDAGWRYVASRFVRRHRRGLALTALVGLALVATTVVSTVQYVRAERARAEADARFFEVRKLAHFMLTELSDDLSDAPGTVVARARLAEVSGRYLERLAAVRDAPADLRFDTAQGYRRLASLLGLSGTASLGRPADAARALNAAQDLLDTLHREQPGDAQVNEELGWVASARWTLAKDGRDDRWNEVAAAAFDKSLAAQPERASALLGRLTVEKNRGFARTTSDRPKEAIAVLDAALARLRASALKTALPREAKLLESGLLERLGDARYYADDIPGALAAYRASAAIIDAALARTPSSLWTEKQGGAAFNISSTLADMKGRESEAHAIAAKGIADLRRYLAFGPDAALEMRLLILLGEDSILLQALGRTGEAASTSREGVALRERRLAAAPSDPTRRRDLAVAMANHAAIVAAAGSRAEACAVARRGQNLWTSIRTSGALAERDARIDIPRINQAVDRYCGS